MLPHSRVREQPPAGHLVPSTLISMRQSPACPVLQPIGNRYAKKTRKYAKTKFTTIVGFWFYLLFTYFGILGWICNGCNIYNALVKCKFHPLFGVLGKSTFKYGLLFLRERALFRTSRFLLFVAEPLYQNVRIGHRIIFIFW